MVSGGLQKMRGERWKEDSKACAIQRNSPGPEMITRGGERVTYRRDRNPVNYRGFMWPELVPQSKKKLPIT